MPFSDFRMMQVKICLDTVYPVDMTSKSPLAVLEALPPGCIECMACTCFFASCATCMVCSMSLSCLLVAPVAHSADNVTEVSKLHAAPRCWNMLKREKITALDRLSGDR